MNKLCLLAGSILLLIMSAQVVSAQQSAQSSAAVNPTKPVAASPTNTTTHRGSGPGMVGGGTPKNAGKIGGSSFRLRH